MQDSKIREILNHLPDYLASILRGFELELDGDTLKILTETTAEAELLYYGSGDMLARAGQATRAFKHLAVLDSSSSREYGPMPLRMLLRVNRFYRKSSERREPLRKTPLNERPGVPLEILAGDALTSEVIGGVFDHCITNGVRVSKLRAAL